MSFLDLVEGGEMFDHLMEKWGVFRNGCLPIGTRCGGGIKLFTWDWSRPCRFETRKSIAGTY